MKKTILITVFVLLGAFVNSVMAEKPDNDKPPSVVDVNVVNTPNVNVVNAISHDNIQPKTQSTSGAASGGSPFYTDLSPGFIHGFNLSLAAEPGERCFAIASVRISNISPQSIFLGQIVAAGGTSTSIAHDFTAPIAVLFDPTTETAELGLSMNSTSTTAQCASALTLIYEKL